MATPGPDADGWVIATDLRARLFGLPLLRIRGNVVLQPGTVTPVVQVRPRPARRSQRSLDRGQDRARAPASLEEDLGQDLMAAQQLLQETRRALARR